MSEGTAGSSTAHVDLETLFEGRYEKGAYCPSWEYFYKDSTNLDCQVHAIPQEGKQYWKNFFKFAQDPKNKTITESDLQKRTLCPLTKIGNKVVEDCGNAVYDFSSRETDVKFNSDAVAGKIRSIPFFGSTTGKMNRTDLVVRKCTHSESITNENHHDTFNLRYTDGSVLRSALDPWRLSPLNTISIIELKRPSVDINQKIDQLVVYMLNTLKVTPGRSFMFGAITNGIKSVFAYVHIDPTTNEASGRTSVAVTNNSIFIDFLYASEQELGWSDMQRPDEIRFVSYLGRGSTGWVSTIEYNKVIYVAKISRNTQALMNESDAVELLNTHGNNITDRIAPKLANMVTQQAIRNIFGRSQHCILVFETLLESVEMTDFTKDSLRSLWNAITYVHENVGISHCDLRLPNLMKRRAVLQAPSLLIENANKNNNASTTTSPRSNLSKSVKYNQPVEPMIDNPQQTIPNEAVVELMIDNPQQQTVPMVAMGNQLPVVWTLVDWSAARQVKQRVINGVQIDGNNTTNNNNKNNKTLLKHAGLFGSVITCPRSVASLIERKSDFGLTLSQEAESFVLFMLQELCDDIQIKREYITYKKVVSNIDNTLKRANEILGEKFSQDYAILVSLGCEQNDITKHRDSINTTVNKLITTIMDHVAANMVTKEATKKRKKENKEEVGDV